jgi:hypothetical protein
VGLPLINRYLLIPAVAYALFGAFFLLGWHLLPSSYARHAWTIAGALAAVALIASIPGQVHDLSQIHQFAEERRSQQDQIKALGEIARRSGWGRLCSRVYVTTYQEVPAFAYWSHVSPARVSPIIPPAPGEGPNLLLTNHYGRALIVLQAYLEQPRGAKVVATTPEWRMLSKC